LPITPGVYIFKNTQGTVIYVGKAKNLKRRVASYFNSPVKLGPKTNKLVSQIHTLDHIPVNSEIEALLLESSLIRKFKPFYNLISKDDRTPYFIHLTKEEYPRPVINHKPQKALAGPFLNGLIPRRILKSLRAVTPYCLAQRPVKTPCFYSHLNLCRPCPGSDLTSDQKKEYQKNILRLKKLLSGNFAGVKSQLTANMLQASKLQNYDKAANLRDQLQALENLLNTPIAADEYLVNPNLVQDQRSLSLDKLEAELSAYLPTLKRLNRIEMFDVAHLSGTFATAAMVVAVNGQPNPDYYRHFKIKKAQTDSDVDMMAEVLSRRVKNASWPTPDLIVLDGGIPQLAAVLKLDLNYPLISLAKRQETIVVPANGGFQELNLDRSHPGLRLLQNLRNEAHRFSRRLHHRLRGKIIS